MENTLFEQMPVPKAYMKLALPVVFSMIVSLIYNMVDTYFIALTGVTELVAGVSLATPVFTLMIAFGDIWGLGGSSLISRLFGEKREEEAAAVCSFCFWVSIAFGVCVTVLMLLFRGPILSLLGADEATVTYASAYYTWIVIGAAAIILGLVPGNILRTEGLAADAMAGSVLGSILNMILDPVFIFVLKQGAAGAAMATVLGNLAADGYYAYVIVKKSRRLSIAFADLKISTRLLRSVLVIGFPASITNLMQSFMIMLTNQSLLPYGNDKIAAMGIALKANMIPALILVAFAFGGQPLVGFNYGAGNRKRLKAILRFAYLFEMAAALFFTVSMSVFAPQIIRIFLKEEALAATGAVMLRFLQLGMVFMAVVLVSTCVCQSIGNAAGALSLSVSRQGVIFFIVLLLLSRTFGYYGVLGAQAGADLMTALLAVFILKRTFGEEKRG